MTVATEPDASPREDAASRRFAALPSAPRWLGWYLLFTAIVGVIASGVITVEKIALIEDPNFSSACDLNSVVACTSVMGSEQASAFGFPNPLIGLVGFGIVGTIAVALLVGARFPGWFWFGMQLGSLFAVFFVHWLAYQAVYRIHALCPYCMAVWAVVIPMFVFVTVHNLRTFGSENAAMRALVRLQLPIALVWLAIIFGIVYARFGSVIFS